MSTINLGRVKGDKGDAASISLGTVSTGAAGSNASITTTGTPGAATFNFTLPRGDKGEVGNTGPANTLTIAGVSTGAAGSSASVSVGGAAPNQTLTFTIPRGDQGIQGIQGIKGDTGNTGPQGAKGDTGDQGPQGLKGDTGDAGQDALWNYTGAYGGGTPYAVGDLAFFNGQLFYRKNSNGGNVGDTPFDGGSFWDLLAAKGDQGDIGQTGPTGDTGPQPSLTIADTAATSITLADADNNTVVRCTAATAVTLTVPSTLAAGFSCMVIQAGDGQVTITAGAGTTLNSFGSLVKTAGLHAPASIIRVASAMYNLSGNLI
jgi:hypothetical protein